jgi:hypothetical protein
MVGLSCSRRSAPADQREGRYQQALPTSSAQCWPGIFAQIDIKAGAIRKEIRSLTRRPAPDSFQFADALLHLESAGSRVHSDERFA